VAVSFHNGQDLYFACLLGMMVEVYISHWCTWFI